MSMYLELSRPDGDVSRWEKILKRLILLNKHYPLTIKHCNVSDFIRKFEEPTTELNTIYKIVKNKSFALGVSGGSDSLCLAYFGKIYASEHDNKINV